VKTALMLAALPEGPTKATNDDGAMAKSTPLIAGTLMSPTR
jgi:hypothetical protein